MTRKEIETACPSQGLFRNTNRNIDCYDEEDELEACNECKCAWDDDEMGLMYYTLHGKQYICCEDCFYGIIGWVDAMVHKKYDQYPDYDFALEILTHMDPIKTGIHVIDEHGAEVIAFLKRIVEIQSEQEDIEKAMRKMKGVA
jgi:hypothetical protein